MDEDLLVTETSFWRRCVRRMFLNEVQNYVIRDEAEVRKTIKDQTDEKPLMRTVDILERNITAYRARRLIVDPLWGGGEKGYGQVGEEKG
jgi:hypothetical protein